MVLEWVDENCNFNERYVASCAAKPNQANQDIKLDIKPDTIGVFNRRLNLTFTTLTKETPCSTEKPP
jgi:hypothetical protein